MLNQKCTEKELREKAKLSSEREALMAHNGVFETEEKD